MSNEKNEKNETTIEKGTEFDGKLTSKGAVNVSGKLKGQLKAPRLTIAAGGAVDGDVKVGELSSQGEIAGRIDAEAVTLGGNVSDRTVIHAGTLEVKLDGSKEGGTVAFGNCELRVGKAAKRDNQRPAQGEAKAKNKPVEQKKGEPVL